MRRFFFATAMAVVVAVVLWGAMATQAYVQGGAVGATLTQCANGPYPSYSTDGCGSDASEWDTGNVGAGKAHYFEGEFLPYRLEFKGLDTSTPHTVTIEWDTTKDADEHALDYIGTYNQTVATANPCLGVDDALWGTDCSPTNAASYTVFAIPKDPQVDNGSGVPVPQQEGEFTLFGGQITGVSAYSYPNGAGFGANASAQITITFTAGVANPVLAWSGHISTRAQWSPDRSVVNISGSSYHTRFVGLDGKGGNQDRSLSEAAVIALSSITIVKQTSPASSEQDFGFLTTGGLDPAGFTLDTDAGSSGTPDRWAFENLVVTSNTGSDYTVTETPVSPWTLSFPNPACTATDANGTTSGLVANGVSINLREGAAVTCTFINTRQSATLTLVKHVINDNGGTAVAADWQLTAAGPTTSSGAGSEAGTAYTVNPGLYTLSESSNDTTKTAGYAAGSWTCTGTGVQVGSQITLADGNSATCTITNDDVAPSLIVIKHVVNDNGGTKTAADFPITVTGTSPIPASFSGAESPGTAIALSAGGYSVAETEDPGYTVSYSTDCSGTIAVGETKTCTVTNDDKATSLIVIKHVVNDNGGTKTAANFPITVTGTAAVPSLFNGAESPGTTVAIQPGSYSVAETEDAGYAASYSGDCTGTIALGQTKTCTITNDDRAPKLTLVKTVVNNNGGTKAVSDFPLFISGTPATSGTAYGQAAGVLLTATETTQTGYTASAWGGDCAANGTITLQPGDNKTCTITNDDIAPKLTLVKTVVNNNGGTKLVSDFPLFINGTPATSGTAYAQLANVLLTATETSQAGYTASAWGGDCAANGTITLQPGDNKTCTITNDDNAPTLTLVKTVVNNNGGTKLVSDFPLFINGTLAVSGQAYAQPANVELTATETTHYGYTASAWGGDCAANGKITLLPGDNKTCTITNDDQPGTIVIVKVAKPAMGTFGFTTTGAGYGGFTLNGATAGGGNQNSQSLNAGTYSVQEGLQPAWTLTGIGGSPDPGTPYNCVVTGSGGSTGVGDLSTQTATIILKNGDTVTCTFENTGTLVTRTQGFWATHPQLATAVWFGGSAGGHTFTGIPPASHACSKLSSISTPGELLAGFWSAIPRTSVGGRRSPLDQARMQLLQQLLAAELNFAAFGSVPLEGSLADWEAALCGTDAKAIQLAQHQAAAFNSAGDSGIFTPGISADAKFARLLAAAAMSFWDTW